MAASGSEPRKRFDKGRDGVVVIIAFFVVEHSALLDTLFGHLHVDHDDPGVVGRRGFDRQFQGVEHATGIAIGDVHEVRQGLGLHVHTCAGRSRAPGRAGPARQCVVKSSSVRGLS